MIIEILLVALLGIMVWGYLKLFYWHNRWRNKEIAKAEEVERAKVQQFSDAFKEGMQTTRIRIDGNQILIRNTKPYRGMKIEIHPVLILEGNIPTISVFEDDKLWRLFYIESREKKLDGKYLHCSIRIHSDSSVQIEGRLSDSNEEYDESSLEYRFQPFYLSNQKIENEQLKGQDLFARGLHYNGTVTRYSTHLLCYCDDCNKSFALQPFHAGMSEVQYFYSSKSKETLTVPYGDRAKLIGFFGVDNCMPFQLQSEIDLEKLKKMESKLPPSADGSFNYYNPLRCPHCYATYVDFKNTPSLRKIEYYGHNYINDEVIKMQEV